MMANMVPVYGSCMDLVREEQQWLGAIAVRRQTGTDSDRPSAVGEGLAPKRSATVQVRQEQRSRRLRYLRGRRLGGHWRRDSRFDGCPVV